MRTCLSFSFLFSCSRKEMTNLDLSNLVWSSIIRASFSLKINLEALWSSSWSKSTNSNYVSVSWMSSSSCLTSSWTFSSVIYFFYFSTYFSNEEGKVPSKICGENTCICPLWYVLANVPILALLGLLTIILLGDPIWIWNGDDGD